MRRISLLLAVISISLMTFSTAAATGIDVALSIEDGRVSSFYLAVGDHYRVPEKEIILVKKKEVSDDDLVVVFFLAQHARVAPSVIVDLRLGGRTWMEITTHLGLAVDIFYVEIKKVSGPPYGKAYGHFRNRNRSDWKSITLLDADIVNFVNLKFISSHFGYEPDEVVRMREQGQSFVAIHDKIKKAKDDKAKDKGKKSQSDKPKGSGKGKK